MVTEVGRTIWLRIDAPETKRIVRYYASMRSGTAAILAHAQASF